MASSIEKHVATSRCIKSCGGAAIAGCTAPMIPIIPMLMLRVVVAAGGPTLAACAWAVLCLLLCAINAAALVVVLYADTAAARADTALETRVRTIVASVCAVTVVAWSTGAISGFMLGVTLLFVAVAAALVAGADGGGGGGGGAGGGADGWRREVWANRSVRAFLALASSTATAVWGAATLALYAEVASALVGQHGSHDNYYDDEDTPYGAVASFGAALGAALALLRLLSGADALHHPPLQKKKLMVKGMLRTLKRAALVRIETLIASTAAAGVAALIAGRPLLFACIAGCTVVYVFRLLCRVIVIFCTERHSFLAPSAASVSRAPSAVSARAPTNGRGDDSSARRDTDALLPLRDALAHPQTSYMRSLAMQDVQWMTCSPGEEARMWRARHVFGDNSGRTWSVVAGRCLEPVRDVVNALTTTSDSVDDGRGRLKQTPNTSGVGYDAYKTQSPHHHTLQQHNNHSHLHHRHRGHGASNGSVSFRSRAPESRVSLRHLRDHARWILQSRHQLCVWSCDILSKICAASLAEDKYGILQVRRERTLTCDPSLCSLVCNGGGVTEIAMRVCYWCCCSWMGD